MKRQRFSKCLVILFVAFACSRETPTPPPSNPPPPPTTTTPIAAQPPTTTHQPPDTTAYTDAIVWLKTTKGFRFTLRDGNVRAEGTMKRPAIGTESVEFTSAGKRWSATAGATGVEWKPSLPPPELERIYQRVTIAFDPQKKEGAPQLVEPGHYRFTNANSGEVHDVWIANGQLVRMTIGETTELTITP